MKKICFDTSSLLALYVLEHPNHSACADYYLDNIDTSEFFMATHSIAEMFRHLTSNRAYFTYSPEIASQLIQKIVPKYFTPVSLHDSDYLSVITQMKEFSLHGAIIYDALIYDALIAKAAEKTGCDILVTYNISDFHRVWPITSADLVEP
ncbi:MAG: type II toxin-antitoxin system VapC family toxin [Balneolaceae bacterium]|nr:type II toxin-antitoxin system VapC family toxin [Balneolaceae bacterium]